MFEEVDKDYFLRHNKKVDDEPVGRVQARGKGVVVMVIFNGNGGENESLQVCC